MCELAAKFWLVWSSTVSIVLWSTTPTSTHSVVFDSDCFLRPVVFDFTVTCICGCSQRLRLLVFRSLSPASTYLLLVVYRCVVFVVFICDFVLSYPLVSNCDFARWFNVVTIRNELFELFQCLEFMNFDRGMNFGIECCRNHWNWFTHDFHFIICLNSADGHDFHSHFITHSSFFTNHRFQ